MKRLLTTLALLVVISLLSFWLIHVAPGDPTAAMMDPRISAADKAQILHNLGLYQPWWIQYGHWITQVLRGNWGTSYSSGQPVLTLIAQRLIPTFILSFSTLIISFWISIPLGLWSAYRRRKPTDHTISMLTLVGMATPTFWLGLLLILLFALQWNLFPTSGWMDPEKMGAPVLEQWANILAHLALPLLTLVLGSLAGLVRFQRFSTLNELSQGYVQAARARGFSAWHILTRHILKNTALPLITLLGMELPGLVSGAFIIEYIFAWPGMGQLGVTAVFARDYPVMMGLLMMTSTLMLLGNALADAAYRWADPRIQASSSH